MSRVRLIGCLSGAVLAVAMLSACTGDDDAKGGEASESPASVDPGNVSPTDLPRVPSLKDGKGAVKDVTFGDCKTAAGEQKVTGTVKNSADAERDYVITVSWVSDRSDVRARGVEVVKAISGGQSKDFTIKADVPGGVSTCTFHVVRGELD